MKTHRRFIAINISLVAMFVAVLLSIGIVIAASTPIHKTGNVTRTITVLTWAKGILRSIRRRGGHAR